ncbi:hypothetical protein M569_07332 [Genlisea aurea]|uniref:Uncharacterized protein n=1 Tax=Genlisea aurea TaxID=192259 RepID=S8CJU5_9LAMI|nr:hypothetical protein M569_07332 [Genlisea aurea]
MVQRTRRMAVCEDRGGGDAEDFLSEDAVGSSSQSRCLPISSPPAGAVGLDLNGGTNCICHAVSRFDTLAGVAIRYGVEVRNHLPRVDYRI